jgi:ABC-type antimicrobial peptide transport system permease subunit
MISLILIISVMVIYRQVSYMQSKNLGYDKANIIHFDKEGKVMQNQDAFLSELKKIPGVVNASDIQQGMVQSVSGGATTYGIDWPGKTDKDLVDFVVRNVDYDLLETLGIQVKEGRSFSRNFGSEHSKLIFNEAAIKVMGLKNPIGTSIKMWQQDMSIIGVVKDFHISSLHEPIAPMVFRFDPQRTSMIMVKIKTGKERETLARLEDFYKKYNPGYVFDYKFLDDAYQALYVSEKRVSLLSKCFAALALLISCLGLFGLAAFNAEVRAKEIGIRKVLGASVRNVMVMLSKDFIKLVFIAIIGAFPLAWWVMHAWLTGFAYRIDIGAGVFVVAGISIIAISLLTVGYQSIRTALMNPVHSLRSE